uniref:Uncharacterized protein n=1 Tax=Anguilla anguilla TaxID=7936 RepID=A0A0E9PH45_ANGAN
MKGILFISKRDFERKPRDHNTQCSASGIQD